MQQFPFVLFRSLTQQLCADWSPLTFTLDEASGIELPEQFHWRDWFMLDVA